MAEFQLKGELGRVISIKRIERGEMRDASGMCEVSIGIYHSVAEFLEKAARLVHPFDTHAGVLDDNLSAIFQLLTRGPEHVESERMRAFEFYESQMEELVSRTKPGFMLR